MNHLRPIRPSSSPPAPVFARRFHILSRQRDGAPEVHRMLIARTLAKAGIDFWKWGRDVQG